MKHTKKNKQNEKLDNKKRVSHNNGYYPIQVSDGNLFTRIIKWCFKCRHDYTATGINVFAFPCEVKCIKCGMYWNRMLKSEDLPVVAEWKSGKYPKKQ